MVSPSQVWAATRSHERTEERSASRATGLWRLTRKKGVRKTSAFSDIPSWFPPFFQASCLLGSVLVHVCARFSKLNFQCYLVAAGCRNSFMSHAFGLSGIMGTEAAGEVKPLAGLEFRATSTRNLCAQLANTRAPLKDHVSLQTRHRMFLILNGRPPGLEISALGSL